MVTSACTMNHRCTHGPSSCPSSRRSRSSDSMPSSSSFTDLPTRLVQRDTVVLRRLLQPAGAPVTFSVPLMIASYFNVHVNDTIDLAENSNLVHRLSIISPSLSMTNDPRKGHGYGHVTNFRLLHPLKYLRNS